ncbi:hypothetical protein L202_06438 [Cryptococcus amylolentus CBS 6039]|uniref:Uncharacterized protein n=1 Tax=Cryptococcus amylolentus CBS 6039 TaxID=1295533 RepID=A0A1E3HHL8_9TREE|nr:hypothetical protein L202_06438 [Cryptococcus amylolentus CBS 6039]ODN75246.1 hypothetical protein L202_06438 [Cryptococcus amylolentus CBS 6039]
MLPEILSTVLPIPSVLLLLTLLLYHLTPLLSLSGNLTPSLQKLSGIIPHPRRARNLPREFFNLPPRPDSPSTAYKLAWGDVGARLGVRGKLMLLLAGEGFVSLVAGWVVLEIGIEGTTGIWAGVAVSITLLPVTAAWLALFVMVSQPMHNRHHSSRLSSFRHAVFKSGGITHDTLYPRIFPISAATTGVAIILAGVLGDSARYVILAMSAASVAVLGGCSCVGMWQMVYRPREGMIRLRGESRMSLYEKETGYLPEGISQDDEREAGEVEEMDEAELRVGDSWLTSPSRTETMISSFDFSPGSNGDSHNTSPSANTSPSESSYKTPQSKASGMSLRTPPTMPQTAMSPSSFQHLSPNTALSPNSPDKSTEDSWLSQDTNSRTISEWSFPSPEPVVTRPRSPVSPAFDTNLPRPGQTQGVAVKASDSTAYTHTLSSIGSPLRSPDGSVIAAYSPDPFRPLPRAFESLSSYPLSPSQMAGESRASLVATRAVGSIDNAVICVPVERVSAKGSSTWTLESCSGPTASGTTLVEAKTPDRRQSRVKPIDFRAPPPPPMPTNMPLPPTPTFARSSTLWDMSSGAGKDSMELLMGGDERDWVAVESGSEALQSWGRGGRGLGMVAVAGSICCWALALPLLLQGPSGMATLLYLISIILPSPVLVLLSYILRYRHPKQGTNRGKKGSTSTAATSGYKSLALTSESQLSLPVSISPKLTPPQPQRSSADINGKHMGKLVQQKPSLTTFLSTDGGGSRVVTFEGKSPERRHTVYGNLDLRDMEAEEVMRKTIARKSADVWFEEGHAVQGGGIFARAAEMLKPVPAMRVLEIQPKTRAHKDDIRSHRAGVVSMLAKRASSLFEGGWTGVHEEATSQGAETTGRYDDASDDASFISAKSGVAVSVTGPSPDKRASRLSRGHSCSSNGENESMPAQIHEAKRGRMSNGPMLIYNQRRVSERRRVSGKGDEYELDWLTAGVLPNLVPAIKIGNDIRVEPAPGLAAIVHDSEEAGDCDTPRADRRSHVENDNESFIGAPSFRSMSLRDQSTPHQSRHNGKHTHIRSFSSSIDLSKSPEYYTAQSHGQSTSRVRRNASAKSNQTVREQELKEKTSFGLPKFNKEDFTEEMRKSFDELSRPVSSGFDLPPIPATLTQQVSTVERVEERLPKESSMTFSKSYMADMHLALELGASISSQSLAAEANLPQEASHMSPSQGSLASTLNTDAEDAVEEMEAMMAMDTPTRAEFVISPPLSSYGGEDGRSSRASVRSISTTTSGTTATSASGTGYSTSFAVEAPPVPDIPSPYRHLAHAAAPPVRSHPHPPPLAKSTSASTFGPVNNQRFSTIEPHPSVQHLLPKSSSGSLQSNWTASESEASNPTPLPKALDYKPSKQELRLVKQLNERNAERDAEKEMKGQKSESTVEPAQKSKTVEKRGLKPLTLVEKRLSNEIIAAPNKSALRKSKSSTGSQKKFSVLLQENEMGSKVSLGERSAKGKENEAKGSKTSTGSGILGVRGLRA